MIFSSICQYVTQQIFIIHAKLYITVYYKCYLELKYLTCLRGYCILQAKKNRKGHSTLLKC